MTTVETADGVTRVRYHSTDVVTFNDDWIVLDTGGWTTYTTKTRMNQASNQFRLGYYVFQRDFTFWYTFPGNSPKIERRLDQPTALCRKSGRAYPYSQPDPVGCPIWESRRLSIGWDVYMSSQWESSIGNDMQSICDSTHHGMTVLYLYSLIILNTITFWSWNPIK